MERGVVAGVAAAAVLAAAIFGFAAAPAGVAQAASAPTIGTLGIWVKAESTNYPSAGQSSAVTSYTYTLVATIGGIGSANACTAISCQNLYFIWSDNGSTIPGCIQNYTCAYTKLVADKSTHAITYTATDTSNNDTSYNSAALDVTSGTAAGDNSGLSNGTLSLGITVTSADYNEGENSTYQLTATVGGVTCNSTNSPTPATSTNLCGIYTYKWADNGSPIAASTCGNSWTCTYSVNVDQPPHAITYTATDNNGKQYGSAAVNLTADTNDGDNSGQSGAQPAATPQQVISASAGTAPTSCTSSANPITCFVATVAISVTDIVKSFLNYLWVYLLMPVMQTILTLEPHQLAFAAVILEGWVIVRNFLNIVFVLALMFVGLSTLFGLGSFDPNQWLVKIVTNAILVNFSLVIAQAILGVADTIQAAFLPNNADALKIIGTSLIKSSGAVNFSGTYSAMGNVSQAIAAIMGMVSRSSWCSCW